VIESSPAIADDRSAVEARVGEISWYHTLELAPGLETKGWFDLRADVPRYGLPERMDGLRALEVGTWDGFWAFEMERRGAEVVALDLDDERDLDARRPGPRDGAATGSGSRRRSWAPRSSALT
jgi:tRNA (mo5U34)-methyltransferase